MIHFIISLIVGLLTFSTSVPTFAECDMRISGRAKLNQPIVGQALQLCHQATQQAITQRMNSFRQCRERFGNNGEVLYLTLDVKSDRKIAAVYESDKIIEESRTIEQAQTSLKLSNCYKDHLNNISINTSDGKNPCQCPIPYQWDGSFPLENRGPTPKVQPARGAQ